MSVYESILWWSRVRSFTVMTINVWAQEQNTALRICHTQILCTTLFCFRSMIFREIPDPARSLFKLRSPSLPFTFCPVPAGRRKFRPNSRGDELKTGLATTLYESVRNLRREMCPVKLPAHSHIAFSALSPMCLCVCFFYPRMLCHFCGPRGAV